MNHPPNRLQLLRTFTRLHTLAWHSPLSVQKKWRPAYRRWHDAHLPVKASLRYMVLYTPDLWL